MGFLKAKPAKASNAAEAEIVKEPPKPLEISMLRSEITETVGKEVRLFAAIVCEDADEYSFVVRHNGKIVLTTSYEKSAVFHGSFSGFGAYQIVGRARNATKQWASKQSDLLWFAPLHCDIAPSSFSQKWAEKQDSKLLCRTRDDQIPMSRYLLIDFCNEADQAARELKEIIDKERAKDDDAPAVEILAFRAAAEAMLQKASKQYGADHIVILEATYRYENCDEGKK